MASNAQTEPHFDAVQDISSDAIRPIPWYIWCGLLAATCSSIGIPWDIAWHWSIGRDAFWIAPHVLIYSCGVLAALTCGYLIFYTTFGHSASMKAESVNVFGFKAPLGAFIAAWGGIAMITSAPFDDWWHAAYGVDVQIVSPPHAVLALGIQTIMLGVFVLILGTMNRNVTDSSPRFRALQKLLLYTGGLVVVTFMIQLTESTIQPLLHVVYSYKALALPIPFLFAFLSRTIRHRWTATCCAAIYTSMVIGQILIFPLIPAQPKLGPVYVAVTHLVPTHFPILLLAPAFALDLLWQHSQDWKRWKIALLSGIVFVGVLIAVEWPFATFLMSKASENRFFGTAYFSYFEPPTSNDFLRVFYGPSTGVLLLRGLVKATLFATITTWIGLTLGQWMKKIQR